ncbi:MAG: zinc ribbon domain-containing protein [bacterium]
MFCHQCGVEAQGAYCSHCGAKLITTAQGHEPLPQDWANEVRYDVLLRRPEVRDLIARHASQSQKRMSADDFLELCDKAFIPLAGVSLAKIGAIVQPIYAALGIKTGKTRKELFSKPVGKVLVAAISSLARHGQPLNKVEQGQDGCLLKAGIPSDMWSFAGDFLITVERREQGPSVEAVTVIKGQLYDWGKSKRILTELFNDIRDLPV